MGSYVIENGWLAEVVNEHTCGTGRDGHYGAHEPSCGLIPIVQVEQMFSDWEKAKRLLDELAENTDEIPCRFDHHGACQEHGGGSEDHGCGDREAHEFLKSLGVRPDGAS